MPPRGEITSLLHDLRSGDLTARDRLIDKTYPELHRIAQAHFRQERPGHLLQPTALLNEAWQKFVALDAVDLTDRVHFLSLCSRLMRRILVDYARRRAAHERAVGSLRVDDRLEASALDLHVAMNKLEEAHPRAARVVELRYFGGLSNDEIAECLDISPATVKRDWIAARAWLYGQLFESSK
jgi:RNA polymerase sigma factor (TIGR02999 family)